MANLKKMVTKKVSTPKVEVKKEKVIENVQTEYNPEIPMNKQRHLR